MKHLLFLFLLITVLPVFAQTTVNVKWLQHVPPVNSDTIYYRQSKKLMWPDFKGMVQAASNATAITSSGFGYVADMRTRNNKTEIVIAVYCYFSKQDSWVKQGGESDYALNHEQHHFDITYLVACLFVQKLKEAQFTRTNYDVLLDKIYKECREQLRKMQDDYDGQTKNGQLKYIQAEWDNKIEKQLKPLATN